MSPFGWDNEFEEHRVEVPAFAIDSHNVTNRDYLRFMLEGGYDDRALWSDAGWEWITSQDRQHPAFWVPKGDSWSYRTMFDEIPLPLDWPVYVSHDEASAYAAGPERNCPAKRNGIAPRAERAAARSARIPGERRRLRRGTAISICSDGILFPSDRIPKATAISALPILSATDGNGRARRSRRFRASSHFRFIPDIPRISSTGNISS